MNQNQGGNKNVSIGYSMINVSANLAYAGMRAQNSHNELGRIISFVLGFPGTLLTYFLVEEGSEVAYGV